MIIVSNNLTGKIPLSRKLIVRINMAWVETREELEKLIRDNKRHIFLDFPKGRTKPPKPVLMMEDAIAVMKKYRRIKYFAISNAEKIEEMLSLRKAVPYKIKIIPKIETTMGINHLPFLAKAAKTDTVLLDKEDLYLHVNKSNSFFTQLVKKTRHICSQENIKLLELQGVIFAERYK